MLIKFASIKTAINERFSEIQRVKLKQMMRKTFFTIGIQTGPPDFAGFQRPAG